MLTRRACSRKSGTRHRPSSGSGSGSRLGASNVLPLAATACWSGLAPAHWARPVGGDPQPTHTCSRANE
eukprot:scaffold3980_cov348-Prasinococcus_capsulatus_cf.AAC.9